MVAGALPAALTQKLFRHITSGAAPVDFRAPRGEPALVAADSVSWRVFKNPVALFVGGIAAVILELAEPRVRSGVWDHSSFRRDPATRMARTGMAAMATVYAARSVSARMIAGVRRAHDHVRGQTPAGQDYQANDPELLNWVQATASFGFLQAYCSYVRALPAGARDRFYAEGVAAAELYGATGAPRSVAEQAALFDRMRPRLEPSPIVAEFLAMVGAAPLLPTALRPLQRLLVRAAVQIVPADIRAILDLDQGLNSIGRRLVMAAGAGADRIVLPGTPPVQACERLDLPRDYLYRR
jgi:uncharacterized protein (DUF2236 family)